MHRHKYGMMLPLFDYRSWRLEKMSPTTLPDDIMLRGSKGMSKEEIDAVAGYIKRDICYRCRIGRGRFYYADAPEKAIQLAVAAEKKK